MHIKWLHRTAGTYTAWRLDRVTLGRSNFTTFGSLLARRDRFTTRPSPQSGVHIIGLASGVNSPSVDESLIFYKNTGKYRSTGYTYTDVRFAVDPVVLCRSSSAPTEQRSCISQRTSAHSCGGCVSGFWFPRCRALASFSIEPQADGILHSLGIGHVVLPDVVCTFEQTHVRHRSTAKV